MAPKGMFAGRSYEVPVVPEYGITLSREDASNLAQAKAANFCGQFILMRHLGIGPEDVDTLYLAGGFANYVNVRNAIEIGFLAPIAEDRVVKIGNAAVQGAREVLLSREKRASAGSAGEDRSNTSSSRRRRTSSRCSWRAASSSRCLTRLN